jgi:predicted HicB family RNase H-like nuclease
MYFEPRVTTAVRLSAAMRQELQEAAREQGVSVNQLVVRTLMEYLRRIRTGQPGVTP